MKVIKHGAICDRTSQPYGYMGWPTVIKLKNKQLIAGVSGLRASHVCPWGKSLIFRSDDDGKTWSDFEIINDTPLDDRDVGLCPLPDGGMLLTWFTSNLRWYDVGRHLNEKHTKDAEHYFKYLPEVPEEKVVHELHSRRMFSDGNWDIIRDSQVNTPHGPILNSDDELIYFGTNFKQMGIDCMKSTDMGKTWKFVGRVPLADGHILEKYCEPHVIELEKDVYLGTIRYDKDFSILKTYSYDGGKTWTVPELLTDDGSPPHLMRHTSGAIVMTYGNRNGKGGGFGERAMVSYNNGKTFGEPFILIEADNSDLGYPSSVELENGDILTAYYQAPKGQTRTALLYTIWSI